MKIVTGYRGESHVTSADMQAFNQGVFTEGNYILDSESSNKFDAYMSDATHLEILDGEGIMQGVHFRIERGTVDTVEITPGASGMNRIDLICARYTKDTATGIESVDWHVLEGEPTNETPVTPDYAANIILEGGTLCDFPMFKIELIGTTPALTTLAQVKTFPHAIALTSEQAEIGGRTSQNDQTFTGDSIWLDAGIYLIDYYLYLSSPSTPSSNGNAQAIPALYPVEYATSDMSEAMGYPWYDDAYISYTTSTGGEFRTRHTVTVEVESAQNVYFRIKVKDNSNTGNIARMQVKRLVKLT